MPVQKNCDLSDLPIKLEICSGSGEWVVAHAAADLFYQPSERNFAEIKSNATENENKSKNSNPNQNGIKPFSLRPRALWLALELRCDRVHHTIGRSLSENLVRHSQQTRTQARRYKDASLSYDAKADQYSKDDSENNKIPSSLSFSGLPNLAVLGGDASQILPTRIPPQSISAVYINHPEPPERTGGVGDSEGKHLLTQTFFADIFRILSPEGTCTIVTDNLPYAKSLLTEIAKTTQQNLGSSSSRSYASFVSVKFNSKHIMDKIILEEEIIVSAKSVYTQSHSKISTEKDKASEQIKKEDTSQDYRHIDDDEEDGYSLDTINKDNSNSAIRIKTNMIDKSTNDDRPSDEYQALQLWRGDSENLTNSDNSESIHASSYFDRMWERGQKKRRWFIVLKKILY